MPAVIVHERGCDCLRPRTEALLARREESVRLEMADGTVAEVVPGTTRTEYGVRCSGTGTVTWWPDVTDGLMARIRMAETDARCDFPHLLVSREVPR